MESYKSMEVSVTNSSKKAHNKKGENIVNKIENPLSFCQQFVKFYFDNIITGKDYTMLRNFTIFKYQNVEYTNDSLVNLLSQISKCKSTISNIEFLPSGSRRFDIMITGKFDTDTFTQFFMLTNEKKDTWYIKSSIIVLIK
jgi:hypothetical protein